MWQLLNNQLANQAQLLPTINAKPAAKKAPTNQENKIGSPKPPRKPVVAGFTDSIASMLGSDIILIITIPTIIIAAIP